MKWPFFILPFTFALLPTKVKAQLYQESLQERSNRKLTYDEFIVEQVRTFPEVKKKEEQIIKQSNYKNLAVFLITTDGLGTYTVKMMEDNGKTQVLHMQFVVDSASGRILNNDKQKK